MTPGRCGKAAGFAYVELVIAALMLALCAVPAANAIKNGLDASQASQVKAAELRCVRNLMETVLAEPYHNLSAASDNDPIKKGFYNRPQDANCAERTVSIKLKQFDGTKLIDLPGDPAADDQHRTALLWVQVTMFKPGYQFTTVVAP